MSSKCDAVRFPAGPCASAMPVQWPHCGVAQIRRRPQLASPGARFGHGQCPVIRPGLCWPHLHCRTPSTGIRPLQGARSVYSGACLMRIRIKPPLHYTEPLPGPVKHIYRKHGKQKTIHNTSAQGQPSQALAHLHAHTHTTAPGPRLYLLLYCYLLLTPHSVDTRCVIVWCMPLHLAPVYNTAASCRDVRV